MLTEAPPHLLVDYPTPFCLYHWSPTTRRKQIERRGLVPGSRAVDGLWRPPFICFGLNPFDAMNATASYREGIESWDLWITDRDCLGSGYELLNLHDPDEDGGLWEVRVYERVFKRDLWFAGSRPPM